MAIDWTTTAMLSLLRLKAMLSDTDTTFTDANLLALMNDELSSYLVPTVMGWGSEFFVGTSDTTTTAGTSTYAIPSRSIAGDVRDVQVIPQSSTQYVSLPRIEPERAAWYGTSGLAAAYYIQNNSVVIVPPPSGAQSLRIKYYRRPNQLVLLGSGAEIVLTVSTPSVTMASTTDLASAPLYADVIASSPPFEATVDSTAYTVTNATTLGGLSTPIAASQIAVGAYFCVQGQSPVLQLPPEIASILMARSVAAVYAAKNKPDEAKTYYALAEQTNEKAKLMLPRTDGLPRKIVGYGGPGWRNGSWWQNHAIFGNGQ